MWNDPISSPRSGSEHHLRQLFNRPWLVALLVGSTINGLIIMDLWWFGPVGYWSRHWQLLMDNPGFAITRMLIPYFVPWIIAGIASQLNSKSCDWLMATFPEANPDLVIKLDGSGTPLYVNRAVMERLHVAGLSSEHLEWILPHDYRKQLPNNMEPTQRFWHEIEGQRIEYLAQCEVGSGGVFISGRVQAG